MTFSIAARCPRTGMLGVATSSKALAAMEFTDRGYPPPPSREELPV